MPEARRSYRLPTLDLQSLNFILSLIADRLDEIEGRRGTPLFKGHIDMDLNRITNVGDAINDTDVPTKKQAVLKSVDAGDTVEAEQTFGLPTAIGTSNKYSRKDHSHGSPAAPSIPSGSGTVVSETTFGLSATAGTAATYSKGDHSHGSPADPVPTHEAAADPHTGYQKESEKDSASGYAGLNASSRITKGADTTDDLIVDIATKGLVLKDTQGTPHYWRVTVDNTGVLVTADLGTTKP